MTKNNVVVDRYLCPKTTYPIFQDVESTANDDSFEKFQVPNLYPSLENPDNPTTIKFVDDLNNITRSYIDQCPVKSKIVDGLKKFYDYPKMSCPSKEGDYYYYMYNSGLQNQSVLYQTKDFNEKGQIFIDSNRLSEDGTTTLSIRSFSEDGKLLAYGLSEKGSDWVTVKFKQTMDGSDLPDVLKHLRYSCLCWTHDNRGVFYCRFQNTTNTETVSGRCTNLNRFHTLYYHKLGTSQDDDVLCLEFPEHPDYMISAEVTEDGKYAVVLVDKGCDPENLVFYCNLEAFQCKINDRPNFMPIVDSFYAKFSFVANDDHIFTFITDYKAPMFRMIQIDVREPKVETFKELIAENKNKLEFALRVNGDDLLTEYVEDVKSVLHLYNFKTGVRISTLPLEIGNVSEIRGKMKHSEIFYKFQSYLTPYKIFRQDLLNDRKSGTVFTEAKIDGIDFHEFITKQIFYKSKDGTSIPMSITHRKNINMDGSNPTLLYGYGGFNVSMTPTFSPLKLFFVRHFNGVFALANIRGGSEYGENWHKAGSTINKQNVFDDFIAAGEYLINEKFTNRNKLIIEGHSNGGLLVAACTNQRPDLFGCVLNHVGVMDMLNYHRFTIGQAWIPEFLSPDDKQSVEILKKYSPLHNLKTPETPADHFPAMLMTTADHDDRVVPCHTLKYAAKFYNNWQIIDYPRLPILVRIEVKAGHGMGKPVSKIIEEAADVYSFVFNALDLKWYD